MRLCSVQERNRDTRDVSVVIINSLIRPFIVLSFAHSILHLLIFVHVYANLLV